MLSNPVFSAYKGKNHLCLRLKHFIHFVPKPSPRALRSAAVRENPWGPRLGRGGPMGGRVPASKPSCCIQDLPAEHEDMCGHDGEQGSSSRKQEVLAELRTKN